VPRESFGSFRGAFFHCIVIYMRILIATGIYPPEVGGPARYASELERLWREAGDTVSVAVASRFNWLPSIARQIAFFKYCLLKGLRADAIFALDTFSAAIPAYFSARLLRKKFVVRVGGDFLWEMYVERKKCDITLSKFCENLPTDFSLKEKIVLYFIKKMLCGADVVVFSVPWYQSLAEKAYGPFVSSVVVENPTGPRENPIAPVKKTFLLAGRRLHLKNIDRFRRAFNTVSKNRTDIELVEDRVSREKYLEMVASCYAVVIPSLSEVSPNTALDALRFGKPLILTKECGYAHRFGEAVIEIDPMDEDSMTKAIMAFLSDDEYGRAQRKIASFPCTRTFADVAREIRVIIQTL
jgi:glycosyltransferase involved in cell wall biosynthesis